MSDQERDKIIDKIKKCLALSASANEHEAAAALRQARKLMTAHGITDTEVNAARADERSAKAGVTSKPSMWETMLATRVGVAFGCRIIFRPAHSARRGEWRFIGCDIKPEIAQYAFAVLLRQLKAARSAHIRAKLQRCKPHTRIRRADLFSEAWIRSVTGLLDNFAGNADEQQAVDAYVSTRYPALDTFKPTDRNGDRNLRDYEYGDLAAGCRAGSKANLHHGVGGDAERKAIGCA